ncbi:MAG: TetR/AcrR family transcriptional regulator [Pseudomonadota bacterium]
MRDDQKDARRDAILDAALDLLREAGWRGASMRAIAARAQASKETLYAWFGNREGLFEALIRRNALSVQSTLAPAVVAKAAPEDVLTRFGTALLDLQLGADAVLINRLAIADPVLGAILAEAGRESTLPLLARFLSELDPEGAIRADPLDEAIEDYLGLLKGDLQIAALLGVPRAVDTRAQARRATERWIRLYAVNP